MLTNIRRHISVTVSDLIQALNDLLRFDYIIVRRSDLQAVFRTPAFDLLPPQVQRLRIDMRDRLLDQLKHLLKNTGY